MYKFQDPKHHRIRNRKRREVLYSEPYCLPELSQFLSSPSPQRGPTPTRGSLSPVLPSHSGLQPTKYLNLTTPAPSECPLILPKPSLPQPNHTPTGSPSQPLPARLLSSKNNGSQVLSPTLPHTSVVPSRCSDAASSLSSPAGPLTSHTLRDTLSHAQVSRRGAQVGALVTSHGNCVHCPYGAESYQEQTAFPPSSCPLTIPGLAVDLECRCPIDAG